MWPDRSATHNGAGRSHRCSSRRTLPGKAAISRRCSAVKPEKAEPRRAPVSSMVVMTPERTPVSRRALHRLVKHGVEFEAGVDLQDGRVEGGDALAEHPVLPAQVVGFGQGPSLAEAAHITARARRFAAGWSPRHEFW